MEIITKNAKETQNLGQKIGFNLIKENDKIKSIDRAQILALYGQLGSGKTTFIQGLTKSLGLLHRVISPTFIIIKRYPLNIFKFNFLYHLDLYRLEKVDFNELGLTEIFLNPKNLVIIEWADRLENDLLKKCTKIYFDIVSEFKRKIIIKNMI